MPFLWNGVNFAFGYKDGVPMEHGFYIGLLLQREQVFDYQIVACTMLKLTLQRVP
jgi:hypothetical protein